MTRLVYCRGCGVQIDEAAMTCPECGAPQAVPLAASRTATVTAGPPIASYEQVPWFRKRWFAVVCMLVFMPAFLVIAFTGDVYFMKNGQLATFPKNVRVLMLCLFLGWVVLAILK